MPLQKYSLMPDTSAVPCISTIMCLQKCRRPKDRVSQPCSKPYMLQKSREASEDKALAVENKLKEMKPSEAAKVIRSGVAETLTYTAFSMEHWKKIRTNNAIERLNRKIRRRIRVVGIFPDGKSALMLVERQDLSMLLTPSGVPDAI